MNTNINTKNKKKGFTLVELLVVIAILAILASVTIVGYLSFTKKAKDSNATTELSQAKEIIMTDYFDESTHHYNVASASDVYTIVENNTKYNFSLTYNQSTKEYTYSTETSQTTDATAITPTWDVILKGIFTDLADLKGTFYVTTDDSKITAISYVSKSEGYATWDILEDMISTTDESVVNVSNTVSITPFTA